MNQVLNISGVECYEQDGTVYLNLETVARGLGFTKTDIKNSKEYTRIDWNRVEGFLNDLGFGNKFPKESYIPENVFYRLAMKARNEVAERFQAKVADEIIPSIRKTGTYSSVNRQALSPQMQALYGMLDNVAAIEIEQKKQAGQLNAIESSISTMKEIFTESLGDWKEDINKRVREISIRANRPYRDVYADLYGELETTAHTVLSRLQDNKRKRMETAGNTKTAIEKATTKIAVIYDNQRLRVIFENIVKKWAMSYCA